MEKGAPDVGQSASSPDTNGPEEGDQLLAKGTSERSDPAKLKGRLTLPLLFAVAAAAGGSSFTFGYNLGVVNTPADLIKSWIETEAYPYLHNATTDEQGAEFIWSWVVSAYPLAGILGGLLCGLVAEKLGRKKAMLFNNVICIVAGLIMKFAYTTTLYPLLILGRLIIGFNCGLNSGLAPMYLTEIAPVNYRGMLGSVNQLMVVISIWISNLLGFDFLLGTKNLWTWMFAFTILPAIWQLATLPFCPESPKYLLIVQHKPQEAEKVLKRLRQKDDVSAEVKAMQYESDELAKVRKTTFADMFRNPVLRWALIISVMMMLSQQLSGINAAMFFSSDIFKKYAGLKSQNAIVGATLGMNGVMVVMTVISTAFIDRLGRRLLMLSGMAGMWIASILVVIFLHLVIAFEYDFAVYLSIVSICLFVAGFAIGPGPIPWFFASELFDQGSRGNANAVAVMVNWLFSYLVGQAFLPWQRAVGEFAFLAFSGFLIVLGLFVFFYAPETKGRQLEDIKEELKRKAPCNKGGQRA